MKYLELFLQIAFTAVAIGSVVLLIWAVVAELAGWYEPDGKYRGPFSNRK